MTVYGHILPGAQSIARHAQLVEGLSDTEKHRIKVIDWYRSHGCNASLTARHYGFHRKTIEAWVQRFSKEGIRGLRDKSKAPHHTPQPTVRHELRSAVLRVRKEYPTWSKYKIAACLKIPGKESSIGRILKEHGCIDKRASKKRSKAAKHPKKRFPRGLVISESGAFIQVDTKHVTAIGGRKLYQFTAIDVLTKIRILDVATTISSLQGSRFLDMCRSEFPYPIQAIQTDNGSEFHKYFDAACTHQNIPHYFTNTHSPKQNSYVERSHRTDDEEFYSQGNMRDTVAFLKPLMKQWQHTYNYVRPHQSLNYLTPMAYYQQLQTKTLATKDFICLQA